MSNRPINLGITDLLETRESRYHGRWPTDPVTTERLNRVINSKPATRPDRSFWRSYAILIGIILFAVFGTLLVVSVTAR